ncbi:lytic transglycosylase domain-containing protein [Anaerolineae bacterium CFX9]|nr:lytic transglycosylase domain-containing protein [Anaerolineae bacterium CFX9]
MQLKYAQQRIDFRYNTHYMTTTTRATRRMPARQSTHRSNTRAKKTSRKPLFWLPVRLLWKLLRRLPPKLLPLVIAVAFVGGVIAANQINRTVGNVRARIEALFNGRAPEIAPLFTPEVDYWGHDIVRWANAYSLDPNLLATVMQIESCGHADVSSSAGAQGLFQVMPFHFSTGEVMTDPETNARRGASFLAQCLEMADGSANHAMACYNGGPSVLRRDFSTWPRETQRYFVWGATIYADAQQNRAQSDSLQNWLNAGGANLCQRAAQNIEQRTRAGRQAVG